MSLYLGIKEFDILEELKSVWEFDNMEFKLIFFLISSIWLALYLYDKMRLVEGKLLLFFSVSILIWSFLDNDSELILLLFIKYFFKLKYFLGIEKFCWLKEKLFFLIFLLFIFIFSLEFWLFLILSFSDFFLLFFIYSEITSFLLLEIDKFLLSWNILSFNKYLLETITSFKFK